MTFSTVESINIQAVNQRISEYRITSYLVTTFRIVNKTSIEATLAQGIYQQCFSAWPQPQQQTIGVFSAHNIHEGPGLLHDF